MRKRLAAVSVFTLATGLLVAGGVVAPASAHTATPSLTCDSTAADPATAALATLDLSNYDTAATAIVLVDGVAPAAGAQNGTFNGAYTLNQTLDGTVAHTLYYKVDSTDDTYDKEETLNVAACKTVPPGPVTATHKEELLSCTSGTRNWLDLEGKGGGFWTTEYVSGGNTVTSPLADGVGYAGGPQAGYVNYRVYFTDTLTSTVTVDFNWQPVDPSTLHCVTWSTCTTPGSTTTSYDMSAWPVTDIRNTAETSINSEQPRSGFGSLELYTPAGSDKVQYIMPVTPFPLSDLAQMEYETFLTTPGVAMPSLQFRYTSVSKGLTGPFNFGATEPYITYGNAAIQLNTWQHWDMYQGGDGKVWSNQGGTLGIAGQSAPVTFKQLDAAVTDIMIDGFVINQGSGNPLVDAYVDNVGFAKKGDPCGLVNFEPAPTVVPPAPTYSVISQCTPAPGTGAQALVSASNPLPTAPNTVTTPVAYDVRADGTLATTLQLNPGDSVVDYPVDFGEDSGSHVVVLLDGKQEVARVVVDTNCADDVIADPAQVKPLPPTCLADGSLPTIAGGPHYKVAVSPKGTGPGTFTVTAIADAKYTFAGGKTFSYTVTVLPQLKDNCGGLAYTGQVLAKNAVPIGLVLVALGGLIVFVVYRTSIKRS